MGTHQRVGMIILKKILLFKLCIHIALLPIVMAFYPLIGLAQVTSPSDAAYWNMNRALSGVTQQALANRGYVANDPRTYATLSQMSNVAKVGFSSAAGAAAGVGAVALAGVTAPAWASVALFIGVSAVASYGINLALDSLVNWAFRGDQKLDTGAIPQIVKTNTSLTSGGGYWSATFTSKGTAYAGDGEALARQAAVNNRVQAGLGVTDITCVSAASALQPYFQCGGGWAYAYYYSAGSPATCVAGAYSLQGQCKNYDFLQPAPIPAKTGTSIGTAVSDIPTQDLNKPLNPQMVAAVANRLWQQAASQTGYAGIPYPQSNPISTQEATQWQQANPQVWPSVRDFVTPRTDSATNTNTVALPSGTTQTPTVPTTFTTAPNPNVTNPAASAPLINLGEDPATPPPILESPPTPAEILAPILNLMPTLKNFRPNTQAGTCPTPSFQFLGSTQTLTAHCTLIQNNKSIMQAAMGFAWAVMALFILLSA
jgi:hypothetical protein